MENLRFLQTWSVDEFKKQQSDPEIQVKRMKIQESISFSMDIKQFLAQRK